MSAEGKVRLQDETVRAKAEAILDSVLDASRGNFSFNIVYRLQAAIVELQKLGLELPPQINCFIQSLVRLSNTITEINTIVNQVDALSETARNLDVPAPPDRDELDYLGRAFDLFASPAGRTPVLSRSLPDGSLVPVAPDAPHEPGDRMRPGWDVLLRSPAFGGANKITTNVFKPGQDYSNKVFARLDGAQDPAAEAEKLVAAFERNDDGAHNTFGAAYAESARASLATLRAALQTAGGDAGRIVNNELHVQVGYRDSDGLVNAIKQNAQEVRGDKDYAIDIGV